MTAHLLGLLARAGGAEHEAGAGLAPAPLAARLHQDLVGGARLQVLEDVGRLHLGPRVGGKLEVLYLARAQPLHLHLVLGDQAAVEAGRVPVQDGEGGLQAGIFR